MNKRIIALLLCIAMLAALLAGCGGKTTVGEAADGKLPEDDESKEIYISYWMYADNYKHYNSLNENPVVKILNKKFNVKVDFQTPAMGSEADNFNLMLGTQDYTDIMNMSYCTESLSTLYEDGVIMDLAPYVEEYMPNYFALIQSNETLKKSVYDDEGHLFSLAQLDNQERKFNAVYTDINDYVNSMVPKFIIGTEKLDEAAWEAYIEKLNSLGLQDLLDARQSAYDRYLAR